MNSIDKARILIIGDAENSSLFDHILQRYGNYQTQVLTIAEREYRVNRPRLLIHYEEILQAVSSFCPSLIVMSYDQDIDEFIEKVRASNLGHGLSVIVVAGRHTWCATADVCLRRPVTPEELVQAARDLLQKKSA